MGGGRGGEGGEVLCPGRCRVGGTDRVQGQVSASPCCFAHRLRASPREPNPSGMQHPMTAAAGLAADTKAELAAFIYLLCFQPPSHADQ